MSGNLNLNAAAGGSIRCLHRHSAVMPLPVDTATGSASASVLVAQLPVCTAAVTAQWHFKLPPACTALPHWEATGARLVGYQAPGRTTRLAPDRDLSCA